MLGYKEIKEIKSTYITKAQFIRELKQIYKIEQKKQKIEKISRKECRELRKANLNNSKISERKLTLLMLYLRGKDNMLKAKKKIVLKTAAKAITILILIDLNHHIEEDQII